MSHRKPALFLHIQKTAGTSIVDLLRFSYRKEGVASHGDFLADLTDLGFEKRGRSPGDFKDFAFVSGHFGFDFASELMDNRYSFTFLRDPIERVLSFYYFCKSRDPKEFAIYALTQEVSLEEFLQMGLSSPGVKGCIWNNQAWQLALGYGNSDQRLIADVAPKEILDLATQHLDAFSHIGFTETFENDRDTILTALGIEAPEEKIMSNANPGRPTSKDLPRSTLHLLEELTHLDRILYEEAWSRRDLAVADRILGSKQKRQP